MLRGAFVSCTALICQRGAADERKKRQPRNVALGLAVALSSNTAQRNCVGTVRAYFRK